MNTLTPNAFLAFLQQLMPQEKDSFVMLHDGVITMLDERGLAKRRAADRKRRYRATRAKRLAAGELPVGPGRLPEREWSVLRHLVFERDSHRCVYCGSDGAGRSLHCDHVVPLCKGGSNELSNLVASCYVCNCSKSGKTLEEWRVCQ